MAIWSFLTLLANYCSLHCSYLCCLAARKSGYTNLWSLMMEELIAESGWCRHTLGYAITILSKILSIPSLSTMKIFHHLNPWALKYFWNMMILTDWPCKLTDFQPNSLHSVLIPCLVNSQTGKLTALQAITLRVLSSPEELQWCFQKVSRVFQ